MDKKAAILGRALETATVRRIRTVQKEGGAYEVHKRAEKGAAEGIGCAGPADPQSGSSHCRPRYFAEVVKDPAAEAAGREGIHETIFRRRVWRDDYRNDTTSSQSPSKNFFLGRFPRLVDT